MLKLKLKKWIPKKEQLLQHKSLAIFGSIIHNSNLWHLNRVSVPRAFAIGLFFAWIPVPFQMALAAGGAIIFNANLPISVALVWLTNPITMPPLFYIAYKLGTIILGTTPAAFKFEITTQWLIDLFKYNWQPFILGCGILAIASSIIGFFTIKLLWRYMTVRSWKNRAIRQKIRQLALKGINKNKEPK